MTTTPIRRSNPLHHELFRHWLTIWMAGADVVRAVCDVAKGQAVAAYQRSE